MDNTSVIRKMSVEAYKLSNIELRDNLSKMPNWPKGREFQRLVPLRIAVDRVIKLELAELIYIGFVLMLESKDGTWYPVRTWDFMTGFNSNNDVVLARGDVELARALKGNEAPLDEML